MPETLGEEKVKMKNYLSFGGGVNSVAMMLLLIDEGMDFGPGKDCEAVYVWMPDWPETHEYLMILENRGYPITIITGGMTVKGIKEGNLYEYAWKQRMFPQRHPRWCTANFKIKILHDYFNSPAFIMIGIAADESHRAKISSNKGLENRFPLIERDIDRQGCIDIIASHGLPLPIRSGCFICPFQKVSQLRQLRRMHPEYWCKLVALEERNVNRPDKKDPRNIYSWRKPVTDVVKEHDRYLFQEMSYPPCECGL